jgi:hypothetical protein
MTISSSFCGSLARYEQLYAPTHKPRLAAFHEELLERGFLPAIRVIMSIVAF